MKTKERLELAQWAASEARKAGSDDAAVDILNQRDVEVEFRDGQLDNLKESTQNSLNLDIYANNRYSGHSTNDLRKESLSRFIREAVAMTKYLSEDPFRALPDPKYYEGQKDVDLKLYDPKYENVTSDQRVKIARETQKATAGRSDKIISSSSGYSDTVVESVKVHTNGFEGSSRSTYYSAGTEATVDDGQGGRPEGWKWITTSRFDELLSPDELAKPAVDRALERIGQVKLDSGIYDMVIENRAGGRALGALRGPLSGAALYQKQSFLDGKLGEKVFSDKFTVIDDPFIPGALGSRLYDGEGMAARKRTVIDKGVLKMYFVDTYYGRKLEMEPTTAGTSNVLFAYGDKSLEELVGMMKKGILVSRFIGGNSNGTTGDFSWGIMGMLVEDGKLVKPVNEMNISGNLGDLFSQIEEMGNDPYLYSSMRRPSILFRDVQFSGR